jgi:hypothetical protein
MDPLAIPGKKIYVEARLAGSSSRFMRGLEFQAKTDTTP